MNIAVTFKRGEDRTPAHALHGSLDNLRRCISSLCGYGYNVLGFTHSHGNSVVTIVRPHDGHVFDAAMTGRRHLGSSIERNWSARYMGCEVVWVDCVKPGADA